MKLTLILTLSIIPFLGFTQQDLFWNDYSLVNPAMSGFEYSQHGAVSYSDYYRNNTIKNLNANYNMRLSGKHGVGLNLSQRYHFNNNTKLLANYNYQFDLKSAGRLSAGIGAGVNHYYENENYFSPNRTKPAESYMNLQMNIGVAHQWKGLVSGLSLHNNTYFREKISGENFGLYSPNFIVHTAYTFEVGANIKLTPRAIVRYEFKELNIQSNLEARLFDTYSFGVLYAPRGHQLGFHAGYDIQEKIRVAYSYNSPLKDHYSTYLGRGRHTLTLGFMLK